MNNTVELIGYYGGDITHSLSAWTSTSRDLTDDKRNKIPKLLKMLAEGSDGNEHGTPFEKSSIHFLVKTDIASHIHIIKHRIAVSVNAESARYKEIKEDEYYVPTDWPVDWARILDDYTRQGMKLYHECVKSLENDFNFDRKRAKESARYFRPYNTQITSDVMFNFRSFMHFYKLRGKPSAQLEIRQIAERMMTLVKETEAFTYSLEAFGIT